MLRTVTGTAVGLLTLAAVGALYGYENGVETARVPPGLTAAAQSAFIWCVFFFWLAIPAGAVIGGVAGLASWLVSPKRKTASHAHVRRSRR